MAEETVERPAVEEQVSARAGSGGLRRLPRKARVFLLTGVALALLAIVAWSGSVAGERRRLEEAKRGVTALSRALVPVVLERDNLKARQLLVAVAEQAGYEKITLTDRGGIVLASTDRTEDGKILSGMQDPPLAAEARVIAGQTVVRRAVVIAGETKVGGLEVRWRAD